MNVLTPKIKTKVQQKKYLESFCIDLNDSVNGTTKFRYLADDAQVFKNHLIHDVEVITTPYSAGHEPETETIRLVNLGTYFTGITATNFFVLPEFYELFVSVFSRHDYTQFKETHNQNQEEYKLSKTNKKPKLASVYCTSNLNACYEKHDKVIVQPVRFVRSNPSGNKGIVMHYELHDSYCTASQRFQLKENLKIVRKIQSGNERLFLKDQFTGEQVESVSLPFKIKGQASIFDLHHIKVRNGKSADKNGMDPAKILRGFDLTKPDNKHHILELMKCVCLSKNSHSLVHAVPNSGLSDYQKKYWPWVLRSEKNFNKFVSEYDLEVEEYKDFIDQLG